MINALQKNPKYFYDLLKTTTARMPDVESFLTRKKDGSISGRTFAQIKDLTDELIAGLVDSGINIGDRILFLCDSSPNWIICDMAIISAGAVSTPRGTDATDEDITYIANHAESKVAFVQKSKDKERLKSLAGKIPEMDIYVIESDEDKNDPHKLAEGEGTVMQLIEKGRKLMGSDPAVVMNRIQETNPDEMANLIYTSGTTGAPKGVMLNQTGWIRMIENAIEMKLYEADDTAISLLPPWHAFERALEYAVMYIGGPFMLTTINTLRDDLKDFQPTSFPSVPRIWESLYNGIMQKVGKESPAKQRVFHFFLEIGAMYAENKAVVMGYSPEVEKPFFVEDIWNRLVAGIILILLFPLNWVGRNVIFKNVHDALGGKIKKSVSGGSALPEVVDKFLSAIGLKVLEGYGMTETSAVISLRDPIKPTKGTVGRPVPGYDIRLKDDQNKTLEIKPGAKGTLWVKSNQILLGYYKRPELNDVVFDSDGYFETGDIMTVTHRGELKFAGRSKDTIALAGGENIEPVPIEDKLLSSPFIDQVIVVGDDEKTLGAVIVPNFEKVEEQVGSANGNRDKWNQLKEVRAIYQKEIPRLVNQENGFKNFELIPKNCFYIMPRTFDLDTEMTRTLKMKRPVIKENLKKEIAGLYRH